MDAKPASRRARLLVAIVAIGAAAFVAYRAWRPQPAERVDPRRRARNRDSYRARNKRPIGRDQGQAGRSGQQRRRAGHIEQPGADRFRSSRPRPTRPARGPIGPMSMPACARRKSTARRKMSASRRPTSSSRSSSKRARPPLPPRDFASKQQLDESTTALSKAQASLDLARAIYAQDQAGPTAEERAIAEAKVVLGRCDRRRSRGQARQDDACGAD